MNTTEINELFAEFLNFEKVKFPDAYYVFVIPDYLTHNDYKNLTLEDDKEVVAWCAEHLLFHKDWNWLMQVVDEIESLGFATDLCSTTTNDNQVFSIWTSGEGAGKQVITLKESKFFKFEAVYNACVEFVKWYIEQNK